MAQPEMARHVGVVAHGQNTTGGFDAIVGYDHGAVVERGILEEDIFDKTGVDARIDDIARHLVTLQGYAALYHDKCAGMALRHIDAGVNDGKYDFMHRLFLPVGIGTLHSEEFAQKTPALSISELDEQALDLIGEEDHDDEQAEAYKLIEYRAYQFHFKYLRSHYPHHDKSQNAVEEIKRT